MRWLCGHGHVASAAEIRGAGHSRRTVLAAVASGRVVRCIRGIYACSHLAAPHLAALSSGGLLDCVSVLARHEKLWTGPRDPRIHLRVGPHSHPARTDATVVHWSAPTTPALRTEVSIVDALLQSMNCLEPYDALAAIESAHHLMLLDGPALHVLCERAPTRMADTLQRLDLRSQSGFETRTRVQLQDAGHEVQCQVPIPGTSDLDLLVDGCVGIETDGRTWHDERFTADRTKDIILESWGISTLRIGRQHIFDQWPDTLATIERMIAESPHRMRAQLRRTERPLGES